MKYLEVDKDRVFNPVIDESASNKTSNSFGDYDPKLILTDELRLLIQNEASNNIGSLQNPADISSALAEIDSHLPP